MSWPNLVQQFGARSSTITNDTIKIVLVQNSTTNPATLTKLYNESTRKINGPREDSVRICFTMLTDSNLYKPFVISMLATGQTCTSIGNNNVKRTFLIYPTKHGVLGSSIKTQINKRTYVFGYKRLGSAYPDPLFTRINLETNPKSNVYDTFNTEGLTKTILGNEGWYKFNIVLKGACSQFTIYDSIYVSRVKIKYIKTQKETCFKAKDAKIMVQDTNGVGLVLYAIDTFAYQSKPSFDSLTPGNHWVYVKDSLQFIDSVLVNIPATLPLTKTIEIKDASCETASDGGLKMNLSGGSQPYLILWGSAPIQQGPIANNLKSGIYPFEAIDSSGCMLSGNVEVKFRPVFALNEICAVSIDTPSFHPKVVWQKTPNKGIKNYQIWSSLNGTTYSLEANIPFNSNPLYIDSSTIGIGSIKSFLIKAEDSCSIVSVGSAFHKPMFLTNSKSGNYVNLAWSPYLGKFGTSFNIWRKVNNGPYLLLATIPSIFLNYTDSSTFSGIGTLSYLIGFNIVTCDKAPISNVSTILLTGTNELSYLRQNLEIFPNPSKGKIKLVEPKNGLEITEIFLLTLDGKELKQFTLNQNSKPIEIDLGEFSDGAYQLLVQTKLGKFAQKIILQR